MKLSRETLSTLFFGVLALALIPFLFGRFQEWQADQEHQAVVHYDDSYFFDSERPQTKRPKSMEIRNFNGEVIWVEGDSKEMEAFVNDLLERLEKARSHVKEATRRDVNNSFNDTFTSRAEDIERFTDWHFGMRRKYAYLLEAAKAMVSSAVSLDISNLQGEGEEAIEDYFMEHYIAYVLKPELRQDLLQRKLNDSLSNSHERFASEVAYLDKRLARYLALRTNHLENIGERNLERVEPDWDSAKWKAPLIYTDGKAQEAVGTGILSVTAGVASYQLIAPILQAAVTESLSGLTGSLIGSLSTELIAMGGGAAIGSIEPGLGTAIGLVGGAIGGGVADWAMSRNNKSLNETQFTADVNAGLDATRDAWEAQAEGAILNTIDIWFDDARNIVAKNDLTGS